MEIIVYFVIELLESEIRFDLKLLQNSLLMPDIRLLRVFGLLLCKFIF